MKLFTLILILLACNLQAQVSSTNTASHQTIKVETQSVSFNGLSLNPSKVEVVRTQGSRIIVETTVSTNGSFRTNEQVLLALTPQPVIVEGVTQLNVGKQVFVNSSQATVNYKIFVPHSIEILN